MGVGLVKSTLLCFIIVINLIFMLDSVREPLCEPKFLCIFELRLTSDPRVKFVDSKRSLPPLPHPHTTDRSKAVVPVLFFFVWHCGFNYGALHV